MPLTRASSWRALTPTRVALLDQEFCARTGGDPAFTGTMITHAARTAHWLYAKSLIVSCPVVEERLMLLFAVLGERWGKATPEGVALDLPLTHSLLATMCAARRPSVTLALRGLRGDGVLDRRAKGGWLLHRPAHGNGSLHVPCWPHYAETLGFR